jgi:lipid A 3-O-deacylase
MAKAFSISTDSIRKLQISSTIGAGIIGPGAGGKQFQSAIHRWINDRQPMGWNNQISSDLILNYNAGLIKALLDIPALSIAGKISADAGTLNTRASAGFLVMTGLFDSKWRPHGKRNFQIYLYAEPIGSLIGYDATLQGGIFNRSDVYVISADDISRTVFQNNSGIIFVIRKLQLEYFQSFVTKEFSTGESHHWGGVRVGLRW